MFLSVVLLLPLLVSDSYASHFYGVMMTYYPTGSTSVELHYKVSYDHFVVDLHWKLFASGNWISNVQNIIGWKAVTKVELRTRSDIGKANTSPQTTILPALRVPYNCQRNISMLAFDPDGDDVRCRFASSASSECDTCTTPSVLSVSSLICQQQPRFICGPDGDGGLSPADQISLTQTNGSQEQRTTSDAISKIPIQFILKVVAAAPSCTEGQYLPRFLSPTPNNRAQLYTPVNQILVINISSQATQATSTQLLYSGLQNVAKSSLGSGSFTLTWTPSVAEDGESHPICFVIQATIANYNNPYTNYNNPYTNYNNPIPTTTTESPTTTTPITTTTAQSLTTTTPTLTTTTELPTTTIQSPTITTEFQTTTESPTTTTQSPTTTTESPTTTTGPPTTTTKSSTTTTQSPTTTTEFQSTTESPTTTTQSPTTTTESPTTTTPIPTTTTQSPTTTTPIPTTTTPIPTTTTPIPTTTTESPTTTTPIPTTTTESPTTTTPITTTTAQSLTTTTPTLTTTTELPTTTIQSPTTTTESPTTTTPIPTTTTQSPTMITLTSLPTNSTSASGPYYVVVLNGKISTSLSMENDHETVVKQIKDELVRRGLPPTMIVRLLRVVTTSR
ncbi:mucin-2-like [Poeciliopsis prolifica]|uniref:mucin-2-like n=1 Tax=Poeciliopsis prolifica TaxID=188132 RepID=UPI002413FB8B|nr:mucin-2-like [Poeciliopsis prolifica]